VDDAATIKWARDPETALLLADQFSIINMKKEFFVIGGEEIYNLFDKYINMIFLTDVFSGPINGDAKFERTFDNREWWFRFEKEFPKSDIDDFAFRISCIVRRKPFHRFVSKNEIAGDDRAVWDAWARYEAMMERSDPNLLVEQSQLDLLSML
jgi:dihydrofolate reductase